MGDEKLGVRTGTGGRSHWRRFLVWHQQASTGMGLVIKGCAMELCRGKSGPSSLSCQVDERWATPELAPPGEAILDRVEETKGDEGLLIKVEERDEL